MGTNRTRRGGRGPTFGVAVAAALLGGCSFTPERRPALLPRAPLAAVQPPPSGVPQPVRQASYLSGDLPPDAPVSGSAVPDFGRELNVQQLIDSTLARNPTVAEMTAAVQMAAARYPQATSLDDPTFTTWVAPASLGSNRVNDSARFELTQKLPFFGKRALRGESAQALTAAAEHDLANTRLELVESATTAFADYDFAERALEVNAEGLKLLDEFKRNAETRYKTGQAPQQDVLQADVELGRQGEQRLGFERARAVAVARLNTLMSLPADSPLPPPAKASDPAGPLPDPAALRGLAVARRPDLQALAARVEADAAAVALARRESYPDVEAMAAYDSFWQAADDQQRLRAQVGVRVNLPVRLARRRGAVAEAEAQLVRRQASLALQQNQVGFDVQQAYAQVVESRQAVKLYAEKILPAAQENVKAAQSAYVTGKVPFLSLIEAQRSLVELRDRSFLARADLARRRATLERVVGGPLPATPAGASKPPDPQPPPAPGVSPASDAGHATHAAAATSYKASVASSRSRHWEPRVTALPSSSRSP